MKPPWVPLSSPTHGVASGLQPGSQTGNAVVPSSKGGGAFPVILRKTQKYIKFRIAVTTTKTI